jgi:pimeloyl-ACP methyl ester carboxylesterase
VLLVHSLGGTAAQWNPVIDRLAAERDVFAVEMPGFGGSAPLPEGVEPTARNLAAAVLAFAASSLGLESRPGVAGISLGAWVAIECGRQGGAGSVVAICPAGFWHEPLGPRKNTAYSLARAARPLVPLLLRSRAIRERVIATNVHRPERVPVEDAIAMVRGYGGASAYVEANNHMRAGTVGDLSGLEVPLTIAWGEFDALVRSTPLKPGILPDSVRQVTLAGCGHLPTWDDPELVTRVILEGTGRVRRGRARASHSLRRNAIRRRA